VVHLVSWKNLRAKARVGSGADRRGVGGGGRSAGQVVGRAWEGRGRGAVSPIAPPLPIPTGGGGGEGDAGDDPDEDFGTLALATMPVVRPRDPLKWATGVGGTTIGFHRHVTHWGIMNRTGECNVFAKAQSVSSDEVTLLVTPKGTVILSRSFGCIRHRLRSSSIGRSRSPLKTSMCSWRRTATSCTEGGRGLGNDRQAGL
jgi:hypothetical protein